MRTQMKFQLGKNGITSGVIESLNNAFKTHKTVRISLLQAAGRDRTKKKLIADELAERLNGSFRYIIVGFTIVLKKIGEKRKSKSP